MQDLSMTILEFFDCIPGVMFGLELGEDYHLCFVSENVSSLLGYDKEYLISHPTFWLSLINSSDRSQVIEGLRNIMHTKVLNQEYRLNNRAGQILWVQAEMKLITKKGQALGIIGFWNDISERHHATAKIANEDNFLEQELKASEERFMKAFQLSPVLMAITSLDDGTYLEVNDTFLDTIGFNREEIIGRRVEEMDIIIEPAMSRAVLKGLLKQGTIRNKEISFKDVRGNLHTGLYFATPVIIDGKDYLLSVALDISERKRYEEQIRYQAYHDLLTGLPNRRSFEERLRYTMADARRRQESIAVLFLDLDGFKRVNDTLGHEVGDQILCDIASALTQCLREVDTVARLGGDEFMIILPHLKARKDAWPIIERILTTCRKTIVTEDVPISISVSIGVAFFPEDGTRVATLMKNADIAMYHAKDAGRDRAMGLGPIQ
jgi:diguanylate cyclase (GGDEF)-like protein/PAS domain S-box-containing protein